MPLSTEQSDRSLRDSVLPVSIVALLTGLVYVLFPARLYFGEGWKWALSEPSITGGLFRFYHPHHLLYNPLGYLVHQAFALLRPGLSPMISFRLLDTLAGIGGVVVFHGLARSLWRREWLAGLAAAGFAFSWGYWSHAINVEVYPVSIFFLVLGFSLVVRVARDPAAGAGLWRWLGLVSGAAVLFHQTNVLFLIAVFTVALRAPGGPRPGLRRFFRHFVPVYVAVTVLPYLAVMWHIGLRTPGEALTWLFLYGHQADTYVGTDLSVVVHALISLGRMLLLPSTYLAAGLHQAVPVPLLLALKGGAAVLLAGLLLAGLLQFRRLADDGAHWLFPAVALAIPYGLFFTFWDPGGYFFWLPQSIPFWLLAGGAVYVLPRGWLSRLAVPLLGVAVLTLFLVNLVGGILPESRLDRLADHRLVQTMDGEVRGGDLVLLNNARMKMLSNFGGPLFYGYARAFARFEVHCLLPGLDDPEYASTTRTMVAERLRAGHGVFYLDETLQGRPTHGENLGLIREAFEAWGLRPVLVTAHPGGDVYSGTILYRLEPGSPSAW